PETEGGGAPARYMVPRLRADDILMFIIVVRTWSRRPMDLSYTQNLEDYHLSLAFAGQPTGTYIDIGAGHPIADNVSFWFYERGWRGIVVEPQPELAALYQRLRPRDFAVRGLIGRHCGEIDFHLVDRLHGLSTT